jgi:uncharacterized membrane protein
VGVMDAWTGWFLAAVVWLITSGWGLWVAWGYVVLAVIWIPVSWRVGREPYLDRQWERMRRRIRR